MSLAPQNEPQSAIVQRADLKPNDPKDPPSAWQSFVNGLRRLIGCRSLELSDRYAEARVCIAEAEAEGIRIENEIKLLKARQEFEEAAARAAQIRSQTEADAKKASADAKVKAAQSRSINANTRVTELALKLLKAGEMSPAEAREWLEESMQRIALHGGTVELQLPEPSDDESES